MKTSALLVLLLVLASLAGSGQTADTLLKQGNEAFEKKDFRAAVNSYSKAIDLDPNNSEAYCVRGEAFLRLESWEEAIVDYSMAIQLKPKYAEAWYGRAMARLSNGSRQENVCADLEKAKEYGSKDAVKALRKHCK